MRPLIFLDIDGVLNSADWYMRRAEVLGHGKPFNRNEEEIDPAALERLNRLLDVSNGEIVLSSTWRMTDGLARTRGLLQKMGLRPGRMIDATPVMHTYRGLEIQSWLDSFPEELPLDQIVILDDDCDMEHLEHRLVKTQHAKGLLDKHVDEALSLLGLLPR